MFAKCIIAGTKVYMSQDIEAENNCEKGFDRWPCKKLDRILTPGDLETTHERKDPVLKWLR